MVILLAFCVIFCDMLGVVIKTKKLQLQVMQCCAGKANFVTNICDE